MSWSFKAKTIHQPPLARWISGAVTPRDHALSGWPGTDRRCSIQRPFVYWPNWPLAFERSKTMPTSSHVFKSFDFQSRTPCYSGSPRTRVEGVDVGGASEVIRAVVRADNGRIFEMSFDREGPGLGRMRGQGEGQRACRGGHESVLHWVHGVCSLFWVDDLPCLRSNRSDKNCPVWSVPAICCLGWPLTHPCKSKITTLSALRSTPGTFLFCPGRRHSAPARSEGVCVPMLAALASRAITAMILAILISPPPHFHRAA